MKKIRKERSVIFSRLNNAKYILRIREGTCRMENKKVSKEKVEG